VSDIRTGKTEKCPGCEVTLYETQNEHTTMLLDAEGRYHHGPGGCANYPKDDRDDNVFINNVSYATLVETFSPLMDADDELVDY
jgi:hypothetical protein